MVTIKHFYTLLFKSRACTSESRDRRQHASVHIGSNISLYWPTGNTKDLEEEEAKLKMSDSHFARWLDISAKKITVILFQLRALCR